MVGETVGTALASPQLRAERLMAVTGIFPGEKHPNADDELASMGILDVYLTRFKRWLKATEDPQPFTAPEAPDQDRLQKKILAPIEGDERARLLAGLPTPEDSALYLVAIEKARKYVDDHWTKIPVPGITADVYPLSEPELNDVWAIVRALDDPTVIFDELDAHSLTVAMVDAWRGNYPNVAAEFDRESEALLIDRLSSKKSLTWQQSDLYRMLRAVPLDAAVEIKMAAKKPTEQNGAGK